MIKSKSTSSYSLTNYGMNLPISKAGVFFHYNSPPFKFCNRKRLKEFLFFLFIKEHRKLFTLDYIFCSDDFLLEINKRYLSHDDLTDIITFDLSEKKGSSPITGEIYISIERVKDNAQTFNTSFGDELLRVIFHGALHLCGYKDKTPPHSRQMRSKEDHYLVLFKTF